MIITIDGPAGSGKSSVAKILAKELNIYYLYTGLLYRAVAFILINKMGKRVEGLDKISENELNFISKISYEYQNGEPQIFFNGENITSFLQNTSFDQPSSVVSAFGSAREKLLALQRNIAKKYDIIADGRDCGSVVFPNADFKFFLTASLDVRAQRIFLDKRRGNIGLDLQKVKEELEQRDQRDKTRKIAPLIVPKDAVVIDNSELTLEQTVEKFLNFIQAKKG